MLSKHWESTISSYSTKLLVQLMNKTDNVYGSENLLSCYLQLFVFDYLLLSVLLWCEAQWVKVMKLFSHLILNYSWFMW